MDNIEQYSHYVSFSRMARKTTMPEKYTYLETDKQIIPEFDFSDSRAFTVFRIPVDVPVLSPYISRQLVADLLDISLADLEKLIGGKAFVYYMDSADGEHKIGDIVEKTIVTWENGRDESFQGCYAIAYLLYLKDYYRKDEFGDYYSDQISLRAQKALDALDEYGLNAEDIFIRDIIAPSEIRDAFKAISLGKDERNFFTDELYAIYSFINRTKASFTQDVKLVYMSNSMILQRRVDEYIEKLWNIGFIFEDNYHLKSN